MCRRSYLLALASSLLAVVARGDEPPVKKDEPKPEAPAVVEIVLSPATEPSPALKYSLLPPYLKLTPGNAAPFYYRAALLYRSLPPEGMKAYDAHVMEWLEMPLDTLPRDEAAQALAGFQGVLGQLRTATLRESCDWGLRIRDLRGPETIAFLLPEVQEMRNLARLIALKARLEIAGRRFNDAIQTLQTGYRLAQDVGSEPLLINGLVGLACAQMMNARLLELIQADGSPNMYWAVTSLRKPLVDVRAGMRHEMWIGYFVFPYMFDVETASRSADEWQRVLESVASSLLELDQDIAMLADPKAPPGVIQKLPAALTREMRHQLALARLKAGAPEARTRLIAGGRAEPVVAAMSDAQALLIDATTTYDRLRDDYFKWSLFPYPQAAPRFEDTERRLRKEGWFGPLGTTKELIPIASQLMPAVGSVLFAEARTDRAFAELRTLEAIRMHAAATGSLPKSLDVIAVVVAPDDPMMGKPFPYRIEGDAAVLESVVPPGKAAQHGKTYRIRLRESAK